MNPAMLAEDQAISESQTRLSLCLLISLIQLVTGVFQWEAKSYLLTSLNKLCPVRTTVE